MAKYFLSNGTSKGFYYALTLLNILNTKLWTKLSSLRHPSQVLGLNWVVVETLERAELKRVEKAPRRVRRAKGWSNQKESSKTHNQSSTRTE